MRTKLFKLISIFTLSIMVVSISYAKVSATVSRNHIEKGETFELVLHLDSFNTQPDLDALKKDFTVYNTSTSSKTTVINGRRDSHFEMIVTLIPNKAGNLVIPAITVGNQTTKPIKIEVDKELSNEEQSKYQDLFAIGTLDTNKTYVNVPVLYTLRIYTSRPILSLQPKPFDIKKSDIKTTNHRKTYQKSINGKLYDVVEESFLIIPNTTGEIKIPAIVLQATIPNAFGQLGSRMKYFSTKAKTLNVEPVPDDISINDWFPASDVKISDNWSQDRGVKEGQLLTRTVKVTAEGVLSSDIPNLEFKSSDAFNVYPEKPELQDIEKGGHLTGVATYKIGYMPIKQGKVAVPAVKLKWYDVDTHKSKIASLAVKTFDVHKGNMPSNLAANNNSSPKVIEKTVQDPFWRDVAIAVIVLWILTLILLIKSKYTKKAVKVADDIEPESIEKTVGLKEIKKACSNKDNIELQKAIINWANTQSDKHIFSLLEVAKVFPELQQILKDLNGAIYARKDFNQYKELLELIKQIKKVKKHKPKNLVKDLYE
ncbi:BatD family protein [Francisella sp. 19X1-34]|uniref:BatD family protein n=1 Tax=Francisella sp. 19X1-34 TaxID=3087177 RepID=UPI002E37166B|nr:BatD family protein [Francisella sp. 19X1-34]MED7788687.1 BatD family protein [Francisella sp. 19X1-34]